MDNSPTTLFNNYEQDFEQIIASIRDKMEGSAKGEGVGEFLSRDERVSVEVVRGLTYACGCGVEQRKTALRRVEMELDEADEMVRTPSHYPALVPGVHNPFHRSPKWKSNCKACLSPSSPNTKPESNPPRPT
jgi:hypothetical protein